MDQRVVFIGLPGSGKSSLARRYSTLKALELVVYDDLKWQGEGVFLPQSTLDARLQVVLSKPAWVVDGCTDESWPIIFPQADIIVWLDYALLPTILRLAKRQVKRYIRRRSHQASSSLAVLNIVGFIPAHRSLRKMIVRVLDRRHRYAASIALLAPSARLIRLRSRREQHHWLPLSQVDFAPSNF